MSYDRKILFKITLASIHMHKIGCAKMKKERNEHMFMYHQIKIKQYQYSGTPTQGPVIGNTSLSHQNDHHAELVSSTLFKIVCVCVLMCVCVCVRVFYMNIGFKQIHAFTRAAFLMLFVNGFKKENMKNPKCLLYL